MTDAMNPQWRTDEILGALRLTRVEPEVLGRMPAAIRERRMTMVDPLIQSILEAHGAPPAKDTYRGWEIHRGRWPEPAWQATSPNYDASWEGEEDGWVDNGEKADAPTREALIEEIDAWFEENASPAPPKGNTL